MKRILLICCLVAASGTIAFAQEAQPQSQSRSSTAFTRPSISKSDYTAGVSQLYALAEQGKKDEAQAKFDDVHKMMHSSFGVLKFKIRDAVEAHNETEKTRLMAVMNKQTAIYNEVIKLRSDVVTNRKAMNEKLIEFGTGIIE